MFTKEEEKQLRIDFWNGFEQLMSKQRGYHGNKVDWIGFNTKIRHLYFRMEANRAGAKLCIDIQFPDDGIRELFYEQFTEFGNVLNDLFDNELIWAPEYDHSNGKIISRIYLERTDVSLLKRNTWDDMHVFLKKNFVKLEQFWVEFNEVFFNLKA